MYICILREKIMPFNMCINVHQLICLFQVSFNCNNHFNNVLSLNNTTALCWKAWQNLK